MITDNKEFRKWLDSYCRLPSEKVNISEPRNPLYIRAVAREAALASEDILQKEHEKEMVEFMKWLDKKEIFFRRGLICDGNGITLTTREQLLQLFRERDGK